MTKRQQQKNLPQFDIQSIDPSIFRAYDIRGVVDQNITETIAYHLGLSFGKHAHNQGVHQVVVARDGRLSGERLIKRLTDGLVHAGMHVMDIGMVPTPVLYYACEYFHTHTGIMITGSHNPQDYNGFKMLLNGLPLAEDSIQALYQTMLAQDYVFGDGSIQQKTLLDEYINEVTARIQTKRPLKVVVDCGNGVVGVLAERFFRALGMEVVGYYCEVDGRFPNHHPDPGQPKNLQDLIQAVKQHQADIGLAFDGDGDRLGIVTHEGEIIWPDRLMMLFVKEVLQANPGSSIIYDIKCSHHLGHCISALGGVPVMYKTGHSLIKRKMKELQSPFAGEMSGHFFFKHRWFGFDDALFSAAVLLEMLSAPDAPPLAKLTRDLPTGVCTPEINIPIQDQTKFTFIESLKNTDAFRDKTLITIDGVRVAYPDGWGLVRASNTTPNLVLRFEADSHLGLNHIQQEFKRAMLSVDSALAVPF